MPIVRFPDPSEATVDGVIAIGGDLHPESLKLAYSQGIFPWPHEDVPLLWFCPDPRAVLEFDRLHISKSLQRARRSARRDGWTFTIDHAFDDVMRQCAEVPRRGEDGTWITPEILEGYTTLHDLGHAHSAEVWHDGRLIGGIYGVDPGGAFAAESMFHLEANASKLALLHLVDHLTARGLEWMDIQVLTPHMKKLGAREIPRDQYLKRLALCLERGLELF